MQCPCTWWLRGVTKGAVPMPEGAQAHAQRHTSHSQGGTSLRPSRHTIGRPARAAALVDRAREPFAVAEGQVSDPSGPATNVAATHAPPCTPAPRACARERSLIRA
eukprot:138626-Chlamydomonas_euryale.AAC.6